MKIIIIGGVAGGAGAAARLRRNDESADIVLLERGGYISYANCGLPYFIGGVIEQEEDLLLQTPESFRARFNVDVRVRSEAVAIDRQKKQVNVRDHARGEYYTLPYDKLIIATGAAPFVPQIEGMEAGLPEGVFTLKSVEDTFAISKYINEHGVASAVVAGGGFAGVETAENLRGLGMKTAIVELAPQILPPFDPDMAAIVQNHMRDKGIGVILNDSIIKIIPGDGLTVLLKSGKSFETAIIVLVIGAVPETALAKACGLECARGIVVDELLRTSDEHIYAVGDCIEVKNFVTGSMQPFPMAGPANKQGRLVADTICGRPRPYRGTQGSAVLKVFDLTCAATGANEAALKAAGKEYRKIIIHPFSHATYYPGARQMTFKLLFGAEGAVLGAQCIGAEGVEKRVDVVATAIRAGMSVFDLAELELCYAPPFSSAKDPVNMAGFVASNLLGGQKFADYDELKSMRSTHMLLDVRTREEASMGMLPGAVNIPVDELRARLGEISSPVALYCQTGIRANTACRILEQNGVDCTVVSGSWRLFKELMKNAQY